MNPVTPPLSLVHLFHSTGCPYSSLLPSFHLFHFFLLLAIFFYLPAVLSSALIWRLVSQCHSTIWTWNTPETHTQSTTHETHANWETSFLLPYTPLVATFFILLPLIRFLPTIFQDPDRVCFHFEVLLHLVLSWCSVASPQALVSAEVLMFLPSRVCVGYDRTWMGKRPFAMEWIGVTLLILADSRTTYLLGCMRITLKWSSVAICRMRG
jgi:hypothetical protein